MSSFNFKNLVPIAEIITPHGIRGELKFKLYNSSSKILKKLNKIWIEFFDNRIEESFIDKIIQNNSSCRIKIRGVNDRDSAEDYRKAKILVDRHLFPSTNNQELYLIDLIGYKLIDQNGMIIGFLTDFLDIPSGDIIVLDDGKKEQMIPFVDEFVKSIDFKEKIIFIETIEGLLR